MAEPTAAVKVRRPWGSKTVHANLLIVAAVELSPRVKQLVGSHPETALLASSLLNVILRHFTGAPIRYRKPKQEDSK